MVCNIILQNNWSIFVLKIIMVMQLPSHYSYMSELFKTFCLLKQRRNLKSMETCCFKRMRQLDIQLDNRWMQLNICFQTTFFSDIVIFLDPQDHQNWQKTIFSCCGNILWVRYSRTHPCWTAQIRICYEVAAIPVDMLNHIMENIRLRLQESVSWNGGHFQGVVLRNVLWYN